MAYDMQGSKSPQKQKIVQKISYTVNTSMKPSCSKWLDDQPVTDIECDIEAESENDSLTTRL